MNAARAQTNPMPENVAGVPPDAAPCDAMTDPTTGASRLSALMDDELGADEFDALMAEFERQPGLHVSWHAYQVIGEVLRGQEPGASLQAPGSFLDGMHVRLQAEADRVPLPDLSVSVSSVRPTVPADVPAANDAVFRWKMVAGLASLAAVMAVSWTVLGSGTSAGGGGNAGAQLALVAPVSSQQVAAGVVPVAGSTGAAPLPQAVVVNTSRGPVIRDPQLEALMAEHRQHGGVSALQMPAGFLRNATYDTAGR